RNSLNGSKLFFRKGDLERRGVLLQMGDPGRSRNRDDVGAAGEKPGEREPGGLHLFIGGDPLDLFYQVEVPLEVLPLKAGEDPPPVVRLQIVDAFDLSAQESPAERAVGDEADAELPAGRKDLVFGLPAPERVFGLKRGDRVDRLRAADRVRRRLR